MMSETSGTLLQRIIDYANRPDPYPLYAELRRTPVVRQDDGTYLVGGYYEIAELLHHPQISSDMRNRATPEPLLTSPDAPPPSFLQLDDPEHQRLRALANHPFGPPHTPGRVDAMRSDIDRITRELLDRLEGRQRIDIVDDVAFPLPVSVISSLLGIPTEDQEQLHTWTERMFAANNPAPGEDPGQLQHAGEQAHTKLRAYLTDRAERRRDRPADDMLAAFARGDGNDRMTPQEIGSTGVLLYIAGHETTVNLITNGMLTLLRHPRELERLRREPALMPRAVEELLRYEPPVQMLPWRTPLTDVEIGGTTIPRGAPLTLVLASGNRDPERFTEPDRFDPTRKDNRHFGFGSGVHSCYGAPLARLEAQTALGELIRRLRNPRLVQDPPPYRRSPVLRGPRHLLVECDGVAA